MYSLAGRRLLLVALFLLVPPVVHAGWTGWGIDFPRTLLVREEIPDTRARLEDPTMRFLYNGIYQSALGSIPSGNSTSDVRRSRGRIAKNAAFVLLIDRKPNGAPLVALTDSERITLTEKIIGLLESINIDITPISLTNPSGYDDWQWRSKEMIDFLSALDMLTGTEVERSRLDSSRHILQRYAGNLYREANRSIIGLTFFGLVKNNHALMTSGALGVAAVVLDSMTSSDAAERPENWLAAALWNIDNIFWRDAARQSEPNQIAGYAEGPYYLRYAALNLFPFFRALRNVLPDTVLSVEFNASIRMIRHPWYDPNYALLYEWPRLIRSPDGRLPALGDTYIDAGFPELALVERDWPMSGGASVLADQLTSTVDLRANVIAARATTLDSSASLMRSLPEAGDLLFRSSWDSTATYVHFAGQHGLRRTSGAGHSQADETSFIVQQGDEILALDPGYLKYTRRSEVGSATDHNMILVDRSGPAIGAPGVPGGADAWIERTFSLPGISFGVVRTAYSGAEIERDVIARDAKRFYLADFITSSSAHDYTWQLHGNGRTGGDSSTGIFTPKFDSYEGVWERPGASLRARVIGRNGTQIYDTATGKHEFRYDSATSHTTMLVEQRGETSTEFLAALLPQPKERREKVDLRSSSSEGVSRIIERHAGSIEMIATTSDTLFRTILAAGGDFPQRVASDGRLTFLAIDTTNATTAIAMMTNGTRLVVNDIEILGSSQRMDLAVVRLDTGYVGYAAMKGIVRVRIAGRPRNVSGDGVDVWSYDEGTGMVNIVVGRATQFVIDAPSTVEVLRDIFRSALRNTLPSISELRRPRRLLEPRTSLVVY